MKKIVIGIFFGILGIISVTLGISYSFYDYIKEGAEENIISSEKITFLYKKNDDVGNGIFIQDAFPISEEQGKKLSGTQEYFDFKIMNNSTSYNIPYEITVRKNKNSTLNEKFIKIYLTELDGDNEKEKLLNTFSQLPQTEKVSKEKQYVEKTIYRDEILKNQSNYEKKFRLRIWLDQSYSEENSSQLNNNFFSITVNVYATGVSVISEENNY